MENKIQLNGNAYIQFQDYTADNKKEFVTYNLALKLTGLGFDEPCFMATVESDKETLIPLWQQAFDFIREKHDLVGAVYANASGYLFEIHASAEEGGSHRYDSGITGDCEDTGAFTTFYKAREACLEKLIKMSEIRR